MKKKNSKIGGFTLIELIVALGVFMVVMTITLSAFLNIMDIQKKTEAFRKVNDNLNFAMEAMMREIREGEDYCPSGCVTGSFSFTNKDDKKVDYRLKNEKSQIKTRLRSSSFHFCYQCRSFSFFGCFRRCNQRI